MDLAGLFEWFPHHHRSSSEAANTVLLPKLSPQKWQAIVNAYKVNQRLTIAPIQKENDSEYVAELLCDAETTLLMLDEQQQQARVSIPLVASPISVQPTNKPRRRSGSLLNIEEAPEASINSSTEEHAHFSQNGQQKPPEQKLFQQKLPQQLRMQLKQPGRYRHWQITANVIAQNSDNNMLYATLKPTEMIYREDRRQHSRFSCHTSHDSRDSKRAQVIIKTVNDGETAITGKVNNISLGGIGFTAPLSECQALSKRFVTLCVVLGVEIGNEKTQVLEIPSEIMEVSKPSDVSRHSPAPAEALGVRALEIRAEFSNLNVQQKDALMDFMGMHPIADEVDILQ